MRKILVLGFVSVGLLSGCNSSEIYVSEAATDKTIMVPAGLSPVAKAIKKTFRSSGWKTFVTGGSVQTSGSGGAYVNINTKAKYPARYAAWAESRVFDYCLFPPSPMLRYDISIVDNVSGEEVAAFSGAACEPEIAERLEETLEPFL